MGKSKESGSFEFPSTKCNWFYKISSVVLIALVLLASLFVIGYGLKNTDPKEETIVKTEKAFCKPCKSPSIVAIDESTYNYSVQILLYASLAIIASITLVGGFIVLLNALKTEAKVNADILKVRLELYKESEMRAMTEKDSKKSKNAGESSN